MRSKTKKQKKSFSLALGNKKIAITKQRLQWTVLICLVAFVSVMQVSGLYPYIYNYARCDEPPLEVRGSYYRLPFDDNYGIHMGSDYSRCFDEFPNDLERDPTTAAEKMKAARGEEAAARQSPSANGYAIYTPELQEYKITSPIRTSGGVTRFNIQTPKNNTFSVREMNKDSEFTYTNLCSEPQGENWSGTIIGMDRKNREICKTNLSNYIHNYIVGINIDKTAIMLQAEDGTDEVLTAEAIEIFSSLKLYEKST